MGLEWEGKGAETKSLQGMFSQRLDVFGTVGMTLGSVKTRHLLIWSQTRRNMALSKATAGTSPGIWLVTVVKSSADLLLHGQQLEMCSPKDQNTLETQRGRERPEGFHEDTLHTLVSTGVWESRAQRLIQHYIGVFNKSKISWKTGPPKSHLTPGCIKILYTRTYRETQS